MNVLLINPSGGVEQEYGALSKASTELPQLGLAAVATSLSTNGHEVRIVDFHVAGLTIESLLGIIRDGQYTLVGFSVYITSVSKAFELSQRIKNEIPQIKICVGGPQVTLAPNDFYKEYIDYVFMGEADYSIIELVDFLRVGGGFPNIPGVLYNDGSALKGSPKINLVEDLDNLPLIEFDNFYDISNYYPPIYQKGKKIINIVGSRGCPFKCSFCAAAQVNGRKVRQMSATRFLEYIELYVNKGYDSFMFYDDTFTVNRKRVIQIAKEIINRKLKISWNCWSRVDCVDTELLAYMKESGCYLVVSGCESMQDKTLKLLEKGFTVEQALRGIELIKEAGLLAVSSFMVGLPGETEEDIRDTINTVNKTKLDVAVWPIFEPYQGTPIYEVCKKEGRWISDSRYKNTIMSQQESVWEPNTVSREQIEKLARYAFKAFYFRPYFAVSAYKIFTKLPVQRKMRFISSAFDYFVAQNLPFCRKDYLSGSRYR